MASGPTDDLQSLEPANLFTLETVTSAFKACKRGKDSGSDRIGNDWYISYADLLIPLLQQLFGMWYRDKVFLASFLSTDVFCLKKAGDSSNPLNYRPLSLLNSDYKLFTRIIATQLRGTLPVRIHSHQHGFVPHRSIHTVIDNFLAAQDVATHTDEHRNAVALVLDFAKAYNTLDRDYLFAVLRKHGYPDHLVTVIEKIHTGTSGRFSANGVRSRQVPITRGIRQGCPLTPLLFILTLETLYQKLDAELTYRES